MIGCAVTHMELDIANRRLRVSVGDLVVAEPAEVLLRSAMRGRMGADAHVAWRARTPDAGGNLRYEAPVRWEGRWRDYTVTIEGRADVLRREGDGVVVEELKSTLRSGDWLAGIALSKAHAEQCGFYALLLQRAGEPVTGARVRYIPVRGTGERLFDIGFDRSEYELLLDLRLSELLRRELGEHALAGERATLAERLHFPFPEVRPGQQTMMDAVADAMTQGHAVLCSAPTGTGKTAAALFPAVRQALRENRTLFFVTAKISQQQLALDTLRKILPPGGGALAIQLTARERSCPLDELRCMVDSCPYADGLENRLEHSDIPEQCIAAGVVDGAFLARLARAKHLCPFETALALTRLATVIVADYNYAFDPTVALKRFFDEPDGRLLLIADEAHNLPRRAAGYYSPEIDFGACKSLSELAEGADPPVLREIGALLGDVAAHGRKRLDGLATDEGARAVYAADPGRDFWRPIGPRADGLLYDYYLHLASGGERPPGLLPQRQEGHKRLLDPVLTPLFALRDIARCAGLDPELFASLWHADGRLQLLCLDPAPLLRETLKAFHGTTFMSATLTPDEFYARLLGVDGPGTTRIDLSSPFPRENRRLVAVPSVDTSFRNRTRDAPILAAIVADTIALRPGNYLAFFPSFAYRDAVTQLLPKGRFRVILQEPAMSTAGILRELNANENGTLLLCAVMGGVFAEGVDFPGHLAIGAFIVGPGLPMVCPEQELIRAYFERHTGKGFEYAYVNPGINRVVQAGGRVIRSETDRGFVMLLCKRFVNRLYRGKFPQYWRDELIDSADPVETIRTFWNKT